ncbi:MAG: copper resistance protein CopC [Actinomycetota bacterium]
MTLLTLALVVILAGSVRAHGDMQNTFPKDGATLKKPADHVMIDFTEPPTENAAVRVIDGCGTDVSDEIYTTDKTLHVLLDEGQPGEWSVTYRVISAEDGHKTTGNFSFTVRGSADCSSEGESTDDTETIGPGDGSNEQAAPDTDPTADEGSSVPMVAILVGGLALVGIAALVRMRSGS